MMKIAWGVLLILATAGAWQASVAGSDLPDALSEPVSIRQESATPGRQRYVFIPYFIGSGRGHRGGGFHGGK